MLYRTCLTQSAKIAVFGVPLFGSVLEGLLIDHYGSTVAKVSRTALHYYDSVHTCMYHTHIHVSNREGMR